MKNKQQKIQPIPFTKEGYEKIKSDYEALLHSRPEAVQELKRAREMGDLSENGFYKGARAKLSHIDNQLRHLKHLIQFGIIVEKQISQTIQLGNTVTISDGKTKQIYHIVGKFEASPADGKISIHSPLGMLLVGKKNGEVVELIAPAGNTLYTILSIK